MKKNSQLALASDKILGPGVLESNKTSLGEVRFVPNKGFLDFIVEGILASCTGTGEITDKEPKVDVKEEPKEKIEGCQLYWDWGDCS